MSKKIPFLQMFAALRQWQELAEAVEGWVIVAAAIDKASRSALVTLDGARRSRGQSDPPGGGGRGPVLRARLSEASDGGPGAGDPRRSAGTGGSCCACLRTPDPPGPSSAGGEHGTGDGRLRADGGHSAGGAAEGPGERAGGQTQGKRGEASPPARRSSGNVIKKRPTPIGELELDMGMVVIEGDVFAVDNRELKKRGAWVVAFDLTDYTGSIRVNKFFPGDEGKPIVDGVKKGMHLQIQGRLNMDRFYGDMVLEPMAIMAAPTSP